MINIKIAKRGINKYGVRKYAEVPSHSEEGKTYTVAKCRKRNAKHYYYVCSCPVNFYKREKCHHIKDFIKVETREFPCGLSKPMSDCITYCNKQIDRCKELK